MPLYQTTIIIYTRIQVLFIVLLQNSHLRYRAADQTDCRGNYLPNEHTLYEEYMDSYMSACLERHALIVQIYT